MLHPVNGTTSFTRSQQLILLDYIDALDIAENLDELFAALQKAAFQLGFDGISYTYIPAVIIGALGDIPPVFKVSESFNPKFIDHYAEALFGEDDFTIKRITAGDLTPMNWWAEARNKTITSDEKHVIEVARDDYQLQNGLSIPTYSQNGSIAGVSAISFDKDQHFSRLCGENTRLLQKIARLFSDRVIASPDYHANFYLPFLQKLSFTQKSVLRLLSQGVHLKQIAARLNISYKYASNVVDQLREKFGSVSRERLLYLAGLMQFEELIN